jgi:hypothetical protein
MQADARYPSCWVCNHHRIVSHVTLRQGTTCGLVSRACGHRDDVPALRENTAELSP